MALLTIDPTFIEFGLMYSTFSKSFEYFGSPCIAIACDKLVFACAFNWKIRVNIKIKVSIFIVLIYVYLLEIKINFSLLI